MTNAIGIIGCGWLGLPLAKNLILNGYKVKGTTTSLEKIALLKKDDITPYHISISEKQINGPIKEFLEGITVLIVNIPPGLRGKGPKESYVAKISNLHSHIKKIGLKNLLFVSSTSVYGSIDGIVTEKTIPKPDTESGQQLLQAEQIFSNDKDLNTTIIRFAGLIGPDRHPVNILSGKENLKGGNIPVNLIHLNDCIGIIKMVLNNSIWNQVLNGVYPEHPSKKEYYTAQAHKRNITPPVFSSSSDKTGKIINSCNIILTKKYNSFTSIY